METLLSFDKVYKDYPSGPSIIHALKETNFEAKKGELIAIVGPVVLVKVRSFLLPERY